MKKTTNFLHAFLIIPFLLTSCSNTISVLGTKGSKNAVEIEFNALLPAPLENQEAVYLEVLDEITGVNLNPKRFEMDKIDQNTCSLKMSFPSGSVIHYRYFKGGNNQSIERDIYGETLSYRLVLADRSDQIKDQIISWTNNDQPIDFTSEISGYIYDDKTGAPLGEILVFINGMRTITSFDGFYQFTHLPAGQFNLIAIHPDGKYQTFQQKADLAANSLTPASFGMQPAEFVSVTFEVRAPENTPDNANIHLLGNLYSTGNSYSIQPDGTSIITSRSPQLIHDDEQRYSLQLDLPVGFDLRYKYSLGDGLINAEHSQNGDFLTRQLIVPNRNTTVDDEISSWFSKGSQPVIFNIQTPAIATSDTASIQFNPFTWMNPLPMWKISETQWTYTLYSPLEYLENVQFRFCMNNQCGLADDIKTKGKDSPGYSLSYNGKMLTTINYEIEEWAWTEDYKYYVDQVDFSRANNIVIKGFAINNNQYHINWVPFTMPGLAEASAAGANWLVISPGWMNYPQDIGPNRMDWSINPSSIDLIQIKNLSSNAGLDVVLFPQPYFSVSPHEYWHMADLTFSGWDRWFKNYEHMILNYADFAERNQISTLIIGGKLVTPSFPNGVLPDGSPSNSPYNSAERWTSLIEKVRARFTGQLGFALPTSLPVTNELQKFIGLTDFLYLQFDNPLYADTPTLPSLQELESMVSQIVDQEIYKLYAVFQKPVVFSVDYYAISGSGSNCENYGKSCEQVFNESMQTGNTEANIIEQADLYQAVLNTIIQRPWISGFVSEGYCPVISNQDPSNSVRGKPAMQVITYYFQNLKR